jgi:hypothetical protein
MSRPRRFLADILGGEERLEHTGADLVGHAGAGVGISTMTVVAESRSHRELAVPFMASAALSMRFVRPG